MGASIMLAAAQRFWKSLDGSRQRRVHYPLDHPERCNWNYMPGPRVGLALGELTEAQTKAALALLESALSAAGYAKATGIMTLEKILGDLEGRPVDDRFRDPDGYFLTLFDPLAAEGCWGWRIDGHHLSLTFVASTAELVTTTPAFFGANPAEVLHGPRQGWRVLQDEEEFGRRLLHSLAAAQREQAIIAHRAPRDIITGTRGEIRFGDPAGLPATELTAPQRELLLRLVGLYAGNLRGDLGAARLRRIHQAGIGKLHFAWAGGGKRGEGHYYRIHGPAVLIEYDNTQNNANHIHTVMRDPEQDFGNDLLRRHYAQSAH